MTARSLLAALLLLTLAPALPGADSEPLKMTLRRRLPAAPDAAPFHALSTAESWDPRQTAVIVCDMWNLHHCLNAVRRATAMAPRMNQLLKTARERGVTIIHAPSGCMDFYRGHPGRRRAEQAPPAKNLPEEIGSWCRRIPSEEQGEYPIDQSDGGEDDDPQEHAEWAAKLKSMDVDPRRPWTRQMEQLEIDPQRDAISDSGVEIWNLLEQRGIENVILLGVHTNMCVLGRPFGLRQMARNGKNVVLMRDLTDTMYNPQRKPFVSHFTGTDLIVEHIEKWVCPTVTSDQLLGGEPYRFPKDNRPHVVMLIGEREYRTDETLPPFAVGQLGKHFRVSTVHASEKDRNDMPGIEVVERADVLLVSVRRRTLPKRQMKLVRRHVEQGKPVVGIRTANHAFTVRGDSTPEPLDNWPRWDADIIGGSYHGHHGNGPVVQVKATAPEHPILRGVDADRLKGYGSLYQVSPLRDGASELLRGSIPGKPAEPIAWTNRTIHGGKAFYTSLGHVKDFQQKAFQRLLLQAVQWAAKAETP